ncbi:MAG: hypothetical protein JSU82_04125 [Rhodospirillales bacterium]|nr:MAG: hypothetical protein JSU82_04125 [Rhodospirillales bacterium]
MTAPVGVSGGFGNQASNSRWAQDSGLGEFNHFEVQLLSLENTGEVRMQISKRDVIDKNKAMLSDIVPDIRPGDDLNLIVNRVGDRVVVSPDNAQAEEITVTFHIDAAMAVSKGAELDNIASLLNLATNGQVQALGTNLAGSISAGAGVAGATLQTLKKIMDTVRDEGNLRLQVEMTGINFPAGGSVDVDVSATVTGWTVTTDWDADEQANFSHIAKLLAASGQRIKSDNVGTSSQIRMNGTASVAQSQVSTDTALAILDMDWNLKTDGAFTHDTISLIQIADVTMVFRYVPGP